MAIRRRLTSRHGRHTERDRGPHAPGAIRRDGDFDAEIAAANARAEALRGEMADALSAWLDATAPWAEAFWERSIAASVQEQPDAVVALDADARGLVKLHAEELIAHARSHIQRRLVDERTEDWPHLKPQTDPDDRAFRHESSRGPFDLIGARGDDSAPEALAGRLNGVLGDIASVSGHDGFPLTGFTRGDPFGHSGRWHPDREHRPQWSPEMLVAIAKYASLHDRYVATLAEAQDLSAEQRRLEAARLWEDG